MPAVRVTLKPGHVKPVWAGHPWVYAQAIGRLEGSPGAGDVVEVVDPEGRFQGRGFWSPGSAIPVRLLTRHPDEPLDDALLAARVAAAAARRARLLGLPSAETDGFRLVHAEGTACPASSPTATATPSARSSSPTAPSDARMRSSTPWRRCRVSSG